MGKPASALNALPATLVASRVPIRTAPENPFARAVDATGSEQELADRSGLTLAYVRQVLWDGVILQAELCPSVERASRLQVVCEDLRPDLIWHRDGASEVIGYSCAIDQPRAVVAAALAKTPPTLSLVAGQWDTPSYRAGMLHGVPQDECERMVYGTYAAVQNWSDPEVLDRLLADVDQFRSDSAYHQCFGMLWDLDDDVRDRLMSEVSVAPARDWSPEKTDELWARAQTIRDERPETSSIAGRAFALGIAATADDAALVSELVRHHGICETETWTPEAFDGLIAHTQAVLMKALLKIDQDDIPDWRDILLGQSDCTLALFDSCDAKRMGQAAMTLLDQLLPGIAAVHDFQLVALDSPNSDVVDSRSARDLAAFLKSLQGLVHLLVNLRDNTVFRQRQLED